MARHRRLPKRLVWVACLFLLIGVGTLTSELEDFVGELAPVLTDGAASGLSVGSITSLFISVGLGVLYFWAGYGLLRRRERWRQRAVYLSKFFIGLMAIAGVVFAVGSLSGSASVSIGGQQIQDPSPLWTLGSLTILVVIGLLFVWALRVLQDEAMRREFFEETVEASSSA